MRVGHQAIPICMSRRASETDKRPHVPEANTSRGSYSLLFLLPSLGLSFFFALSLSISLSLAHKGLASFASFLPRIHSQYHNLSFHLTRREP